MTITGQNIIGFSRSSKGSTSFTSFNPVTNKALNERFFTATQDEINEAMNKASVAFKAFKKIPTSVRANFLREIAIQINACSETLTAQAILETGLPEVRIKGETGRTCGQLKLFADLIEEGSWVDARIENANPDRTPLPKPDLRSMLTPLGPVVVFGASNFPLAFSTAGADTASALAAGCPVVVKAHPSHPGTSEIVGQAILKAAQKNNLPDGIFSLLFDDGTDVAVELAKHKHTSAIGFTGSHSGGRALMDIAAARKKPIPVYAEMGSVNPVIMLPSAMDNKTEALANGLATSMTMGVGQFCTSPGLVFTVKSKSTDQFYKMLTDLLKEIPAATMLSHKICESYSNKLADTTTNESVTTLLNFTNKGGNDIAPSLLKTTGALFKENSELDGEIFGPVSLLIECESVEEIEQIVKSLDGQLTATIHGTEEDLSTYSELTDHLSQLAGRVIFNTFPTGVDVSHAMVHGGPYPASSDGRSTSVGTQAIFRFTRLVSYQGFPNNALPEELKNGNPLGIFRTVDSQRVQS